MCPNVYRKYKIKLLKKQWKKYENFEPRTMTIDFQFSIMHYELFQGVPAPLRSAVGLSAISFSASLQKDAAPIPNALGATNSKVLSLTFMYGRGLPHCTDVACRIPTNSKLGCNKSRPYKSSNPQFHFFYTLCLIFLHHI